jgi:hypothetical protein
MKLISKDLPKEPFSRNSLAGITYQKIHQKSQVANSLIGMSLGSFERLYTDFELAHIARENNLQFTRHDKLKRKRTAGAGRKHKYSLRDRLLMALFWLRAYTTYEVLGCFYDLDKTTVEDNVKNVLGTLATVSSFHFELPGPGVPKLRSVKEVINAFPDIRMILDVKE